MERLKYSLSVMGIILLSAFMIYGSYMASLTISDIFHYIFH